MNFEDLSILQTGQALLSKVVEVSDLRHFDKFHLSSIEYKQKLACWPSHSLLRFRDPTWMGGSYDHLSTLLTL